MSDERSGGVEGLRAWVADAAERVRRLTPAMGAVDLKPSAYDASIAELDQLERLLDHDPGARSAVSVWLGGALAMRLSAGGGSPEGGAADRERAERLLREVRDPGTALGAAAGAEDRRWAALYLVTAVTPIRVQPGGFGGVADLSALVDWLGREGAAGIAAFTAELRELAPEVLELPLPPAFLAELERMRGLYSGTPGPEFTDLLMSVLPATGDPGADRMRELLGEMFGRMFAASEPGPAAEPGAAAEAGPAAEPRHAAAPDPAPKSEPKSEPEPEPKSEPDPEPDPERAPDPSPVPDPGLTHDDLRRLAAGLDAVSATTEGLGDILESGDQEALAGLIRRVRAVQDEPPPGPDRSAELEAMRAFLLHLGAGVGGTFQDRSVSRGHLDLMVGQLESLDGPMPQGGEYPAFLGRAFALYSKVMEAGETADVPVLRGLVDEAEALARTVPDDHRFRFLADLTLAGAYIGLGTVVKDDELLLRALHHSEKGRSGARESGLPFGDALHLPHLPDLDLLRAGLSGTTVPEFDHVPPPPGAAPDQLDAAAQSAALHYSLTREPAALDALIDVSERLRDAVRAGRAPRIAADALWRLAEAYRVRGVLDEDVRDLRALDAAKESLAALAADVLLQAGAEHGLLAARAGANRGLQAALWAGSQGRLHEAVASLELGRALVLHAASTSSAVPELLDAGGHHELAEAWRTTAGQEPQDPQDPQEPQDPQDPQDPQAAATGPGASGERGVPDELPSAVRRRTLEALGYRREGGPLGTPSLSDLADGLADSGADALVYLVPGEDEYPGVALLVAPALGAALKVLPPLSGVASAPLERYLDATELRDTAVREGSTDGPSAAAGWEESLGELCDWAHDVLGPVVADLEVALSESGARDGQPLRLVLVPCGRLGIVPWHAARLPGDAPHDYLCRTTVISYAASGGQFLRTVRRAPRDPVAAPVLIADPTLDLTHAEVEVMALRDAFYRQARLCGGIFEVPEDDLAAGTPDEVLAFLADGVSLLHVASHGAAGARPTVSALHLAAPRSADPGTDEGGTEPGLLTVTRLLDRAEGRQGVEDGPLVVLSACQTDLSTRDHDEALTLTTAFVAGGARDVVGSRWTTDDGVSALLMTVFHHHVTVDGMSPVDALRAAQLWMLDPRRENPGSLSGVLARQAERTDLDRISLWAAFIHQGHPGRGDRAEAAEAGEAGGAAGAAEAAGAADAAEGAGRAADAREH